MAKDMYQKRRERQENKKNETYDEKKTNINWYPGHMAKTKRIIKENINLIDIVYVVLDSRIPRTSKVKEIDSLLKNKPKVLIMTKYDLCDQKETDAFIDLYQKEGYEVLKCDLINDKNLNELYTITNNLLKEKIAHKEKQGLIKTITRVLVIGIPNVGKSTLINRITKRKATKTGNKPGVTTGSSWIKGDNNMMLLDTPGILWPKLEQKEEAFNLASTSAIKEEIIPISDVAVYIIKTLYKYYKEKLIENYQVTSIDSFEEVFETIGRKKNLIQAGNVVDYDRVAKFIVNDIKQGKIKGITFDRIKND